jgi:heat shock protein HslJ
MTRLALIMVFLLSACTKDETVSGYVDNSTVFKLVEMSGKPFLANATIQFPAAGVAAGRAPCNSYSAAQTVPLPWIEIIKIRSSRTACPELPIEKQFFEALGAMTRAEPSGPILIMRNDNGAEMIFHAFKE